MQQDSQLGVQQSSTALALRPGGSQALVLSSGGGGGGEVALLDEADVPRAEHQLRQKVMMHTSLSTAPALPPSCKPSLAWDMTHHDQSKGKGTGRRCCM